MNNLRIVLAALALSLPLAACTQPVGETDAAGSSTDPVATSEKAIDSKGEIAGVLTKIDAKFARWIPSPTGQPAGMLLEDGTFVRVHHDTKTDTLTAGDAVQVEGIKHDAGFVGASVKKGDTVVVEAPKHAGKLGHFGKHDGKHAKKHEGKDGEWKHAWKHDGKHPEMSKALEALTPMNAVGTVSAVIPGRHGKVHALVLSDGTVAYARRHSDAFASVKKGDAVKLEGKGGSYAIGKSMIVETVAPVDAKPL